MTKAIFFDRDGVLVKTNVINGKPYAVRTLAEFEILSCAYEVVTNFKKAGYLIGVVTNQPDVAHGLVNYHVVEEMHKILKTELPIDIIKVCYHKQDAGCECRKPKSGMILSAAQEFNINLMQSIMVGDRPQDIVAGYNANCFTVLINNNYNEKLIIEPDLVVNNLSEVTLTNIEAKRVKV